MKLKYTVTRNNCFLQLLTPKSIFWLSPVNFPDLYSIKGPLKWRNNCIPLWNSIFGKKITPLNYFFEKCRVWQLRVTDGTKLVHINQNRKSKNSVFFSEWNLGDLSATKFYLYLNAVFLENLPNLLLTNGKVYICSNQILFPTNLHLLMVLMESSFLK